MSNKLHASSSAGFVLAPSLEVVQSWAGYVRDAVEMGMRWDGGWGPCRSAQVRWCLTKAEMSYKCGDGGDFDLKPTRRITIHDVDMTRLVGLTKLYESFLLEAALTADARGQEIFWKAIRLEWVYFDILAEDLRRRQRR